MPETVRSFDGTRIAYTVQGTGPAVLLLHGFAADHVLNWVRPGVIDALTAAGSRGIATALLADDSASIPNVAGKAFRQFADATGADRHALAALSRSSALRFEVRFDAIRVPTLVVVGADDTLIRSPDELADRLPSARLVTVAGDHLGAPYDPAFARAIVDFLDQAHRND